METRDFLNDATGKQTVRAQLLDIQNALKVLANHAYEAGQNAYQDPDNNTEYPIRMTLPDYYDDPVFNSEKAAIYSSIAYIDAEYWRGCLSAYNKREAVKRDAAANGDFYDVEILGYVECGRATGGHKETMLFHDGDEDEAKEAASEALTAFVEDDRQTGYTGGYKAQYGIVGGIAIEDDDTAEQIAAIRGYRDYDVLTLDGTAFVIKTDDYEPCGWLTMRKGE